MKSSPEIIGEREVTVYFKYFERIKSQSADDVFKVTEFDLYSIPKDLIKEGIRFKEEQVYEDRGKGTTLGYVASSYKYYIMGVINENKTLVTVIDKDDKYYHLPIKTVAPNPVYFHESNEATRTSVGVRFDLLEWGFIHKMAEVMAYGANKYGDNNWKKGLPGEKSGLNHAVGHIRDYKLQVPSDIDNTIEMNLAQVAINAMFEYYHYTQELLKKEAEEIPDESSIHKS